MRSTNTTVSRDVSGTAVQSSTACMPESLALLVSRTAGPSPPNPHDVVAEEMQRRESYARAAAQPVPTPDLLRQVDEMEDCFCRMLELLTKVGCPAPHTPDSQRHHEEQMTHQMTEATGHLQACVAALQHGIRSKIGQCTYFAVVQQLKNEIAERQRAVEKMDAVLHAVHKALEGEGQEGRPQ